MPETPSFDPNDPNSYLWDLSPRRGIALFRTLATIALALALPPLVFVVLLLLHPLVGDSAHSVVLGLVGVLALVRLLELRAPARWRLSRAGIPLYLVMMGGTAFLLHTSGGLSVEVGHDGPLGLVLFYAEQVTRVAMFDYVDIFEVSWSSFEATSTYARALLMGFNLLATAGLVEAVFGAIRDSKDQRFYGTAADLREHLWRRGGLLGLNVRRAAVLEAPEQSHGYTITDIEALGKADDVDDTERFVWRIYSESRSLLWGMVNGVSLGFAGPLGLFAVLWVIGFFLPTVALWMGVGVFVLFALAWLMYAFALTFFSDARNETEDYDPDMVYFLGLILIGSLAYLLYSPVSPLTAGFAEVATTAWGWLLFFTDALLWVVCVDLMELFDLNLSPMHPTTWSARLTMMVLNVLITAGVIEAVLMSIRNARHEHTYIGTTKQLVDKYAVSMSEADDAVFEAEEQLWLMEEPGVRASEFLAALHSYKPGP